PGNTGWFAQQDIAAMDITANRPSLSARRFEAGTPAVVNCYAAEAGLKIILDTGTDAIEERVRSLTRRCMEGLAGIGWPAITPAADARRGPMVAVPSRDAAGLFARLLEQDIVTSFRDNNLRAGIHFYNSDEDIDRFVAVMAGHRARFAPQA
ncbi:MAG: aminotransferase class V-fold PLP-dependent enzyme, partial [Steroidobacteraceae bacterium]